MKKIKNIQNTEAGFASITIAFTMIIVLALLVVGFAQLARREQQSALDKQLSAQAFYAAETGVNDMRELIDNGQINSKTNLNTTECLGGIDSLKNINSTTGVAYTCAIVNLLPKELKFQGLLPGTSKVSNFQATNQDGAPVALSSLKIEWTSDGATGTYPAGESLLPFSEWNNQNYPSVVQFALTPYTSNSAQRTTLMDNTGTTFLYPGTSDSAPSFASMKGVNAGSISKAGCDGNRCTVTITGIGSPEGAENLLNIINMYVKADVTITGTTGTDAGGNAVHFKGAQAMVDVTGKARNVLKRLQVRIPLDDSKNLPGYALEAQNICKRIETAPAPGVTTYNSSGLGVPDTIADACKLSAD